MADSDKLRNYTRADPPKLEGNDVLYLRNELLKLQTAISLLVTTVKQLDVRCVAHGI